MRDAFRITLTLAAMLILVASGCMRAPTAASTRYSLGRPVDPAEIARRDIDVSPDGAGLPTGHGDAVSGERLFALTCRRCHGAAVRLDPQRWPYATTLFDYVRRAMPPDRAAQLRPDELYAITAYELATNGVVGSRVVLDRETLPRVAMPGLKAFFESP